MRLFHVEIDALAAMLTETAREGDACDVPLALTEGLAWRLRLLERDAVEVVEIVLVDDAWLDADAVARTLADAARERVDDAETLAAPVFVVLTLGIFEGVREDEACREALAEEVAAAEAVAWLLTEVLGVREGGKPEQRQLLVGLPAVAPSAGIVQQRGAASFAPLPTAQAAGANVYAAQLPTHRPRHQASVLVPVVSYVSVAPPMVDQSTLEAPARHVSAG